LAVLHFHYQRLFLRWPFCISTIGVFFCVGRLAFPLSASFFALAVLHFHYRRLFFLSTPRGHHKTGFLRQKGLLAAPKGVIFSQQGHRPRRRCIFAADLTFKPAGAAFTATITVFGVNIGTNCSHNHL